MKKIFSDLNKEEKSKGKLNWNLVLCILNAMREAIVNILHARRNHLWWGDFFQLDKLYEAIAYLTNSLAKLKKFEEENSSLKLLIEELKKKILKAIYIELQVSKYNIWNLETSENKRRFLMCLKFIETSPTCIKWLLEIYLGLEIYIKI